MEYNVIPAQDVVAKTAEALKSHNVEPIIVANKEEAFAKIKELIPAGASVMNGSSKTLEQMGFIEYLKSGAHGWNNLHAGIVAEKDPVKQKKLRLQAELSDFYLGSVHALTQAGEMMIASSTGSQMPHIVYTSQNVIFVVSTQKIVPTLTEGMDRIKSYIVPQEEVHMQELYGPNAHTALNKLVVFFAENPVIGRKVRVILINEKLGF